MASASYLSRPDPLCATSRRRTLGLAGAYLLCGAICLPGPIFAQPSLNERVLVVYNASGSGSLAVAKYYMAQRKIPESHKCKIDVGSDDVIKREDFDARVKMPLRKCLEATGRQKILYIVFSYRTPYLLTAGDRSYSLDQFVADIWDEYSASRPGNEVGPHAYFGGAQSQGNAYESFVPLATYRDQPRALTIYSVWRLDGANADVAKGLVNNALLAETSGLSGKACFDLQSGGIDALPDVQSTSGDWDLHQAADFSRRSGFAVTEDDQKTEFGTPPAPLRCDGAALYAGWYSLNHYNDAFSWNPGAIGIHLDSASAVNPRGGTNWSANALIKGITVTSGAVSEPYLTGLPHPDQLFLYLFQGANVGDAFLRSTAWLKWMILNFGDPLYRPFPHGLAPYNTPGATGPFLILLPQVLAGGNPSSGVVGLSKPAPEGGTTVSLTSEQPEIVGVPKTITIPAGANTAKFPITTRNVTSETIVRVSMAAGQIKKSNTLVLLPHRS